jgi:hypothetical protein
MNWRLVPEYRIEPSVRLLAEPERLLGEQGRTGGVNIRART